MVCRAKMIGSAIVVFGLLGFMTSSCDKDSNNNKLFAEWISTSIDGCSPALTYIFTDRTAIRGTQCLGNQSSDTAFIVSSTGSAFEVVSVTSGGQSQPVVGACDVIYSVPTTIENVDFDFSYNSAIIVDCATGLMTSWSDADSTDNNGIGPVEDPLEFDCTLSGAAGKVVTATISCRAGGSERATATLSYTCPTTCLPTK